MEPRRKRMVRADKAPNVLRCSSEDWMAYWCDCVKERPSWHRGES